MTKLSSFSVILVFAVMMVLGVALAPLLDIGTQPVPRQGNQLTISYQWPQVSAKVVEQNLTAPIEGMVSALKDVQSVSSRSAFGRSEIYVTLKEKANVSSVKFAISSLLRQSYSKLPKGVSYPALEGGEMKNGQKSHRDHQLLLTYHVNADMQPNRLKRIMSGMVVKRLESIDGVAKAEVTGTQEHYMEVNYDPVVLSRYGLTTDDMKNAICNYIGKDEVIGTIVQPASDQRRERVAFRLRASNHGKVLSDIPVKRIGGKIVFLNDLAQIQVREYEPTGYYRVNGLNTIYINVYAASDAKMVSLSDEIQAEMNTIESELQQRIYVRLAYDDAQQQREEMAKLFSRSLLALLCLLAFVFVVYRNVKYLSVVTLSLAANILMAIIAYRIFDLKLHVYSLAGITVSLGLIIDSTIVMADHYSYYHDRKAFMSILAAMLTSMAALVVVFFLPKEMQADLYDFAWIVIINLGIALLVALFLVPALMEQWHCVAPKVLPQKGRWIVRFNRLYHRYLLLTSRHRWIYCLLLAWAFGIPFHLMPESWEIEKLAFLKDYLGGTVELFANYLDEGSHQRDADEKKVLHIQGQMPVGGTAAQMNGKMILVEELLKKHSDEIKEFVTRIDGRRGEITVTFKDSTDASFPYRLESKVIGKMIMIGGADWSTYGVSERGFSNSLNLQYRANHIKVSGYNYAQLYRLSENISDYLARNPRVQDLTIETPGFENQEDELFMGYQNDRFQLYDLDASLIHQGLKNLLSKEYVGEYKSDQMVSDVYLQPKASEAFDAWHIENSQILVGGTPLLVPEVMHLQRREAKEVIPKENQEYVLNVSFNLLGSYTYTTEYLDSVMGHFKRVLPVGYHCETPQYRNPAADSTNYRLLLLVVALIFLICSVVFESLRMAWVVVSMIPVSLMGAFLTFVVTGVEFGSGGFASLLLLGGIVVNSSIYILCQYRRNIQEAGYDSMRAYLRAFNHKIIPVYLTIVSTIVGLVPFFFEREEEAFWFSFATGVAGGLMFSILALVFVMPLFLKLPLVAHSGLSPRLAHSF